jgi:hypothetical protein
MRHRLTALLVALGTVAGCHLIGGIEEGTPACRIDGARNGLETDVDCGGPCAPCVDGARCQEHEDCASNSCYVPCSGEDCDGVERCAVADCDDDRLNGAETDVDCGSANGECPRCIGEERCLVDLDCASSASMDGPVCVDGRCLSLCCNYDCPDSCCTDGEEDCCAASCGPEQLGEACNGETLFCEEPLDCFYETDVAEFGECE